MSCIVLVRMQGGSLVAICDDDKLHEFSDEGEAETFMENHILAPLGWLAVEVDV